MDTQKNRLNETVLLSTQNICLDCLVRKLLHFYAQKVCLTRPMIAVLISEFTGFWTHIGIEKKFENNYIYFFINGVSYKVDGAPKDVPLKTPGTIRFGNSQPVNSANGHMQGRVTCVRLKAGTFTSGNVAHCLSSNWPSGTDLYNTIFFGDSHL